MKKIKVIVADDHAMMLDGLVEILEKDESIEIMGVAPDGNKALALVQDNEVDIAILDIEMPGINGVKLAGIIQEKYLDTKVLILTMHKSKEFAEKIVASGAKGYILKNNGREELLGAVHAIYNGKTFYSQEVVEVLLKAVSEKKEMEKEVPISLTRRERDVLILIAQGKTSNEIAGELFIAPCTVDTHRRNLIDKTHVNSSKELIIFALKNPHLLEK